MNSIVEYFAEHEGYKCGYCKSPNSNYSHGMWAHHLTVNDYQDLIDRGWRRSGKYCYKPTMDVMCCPMYTIKCSVKDFKLSKSQKKVLKRMNKFLINGKNKEMVDSSSQCSKDDYQLGDNIPNEFPDISVIQKANSKIEKGDEIKFNSSLEDEFGDKNLSSGVKPPTKTTTDSQINKETLLEEVPKKKDKVSDPKGIDPSKPLCRKAKDIRREKKRLKLEKKAQGAEIMQVSKPAKCESKVKTLEEFLSESQVPNAIHNLEIKLVRSEPISVEFEATFPQTLEIYQKYQNVIHDDPLEKCTKKQFNGFLVSSPLQVKLVRSQPQSREFAQSLTQELSLYQVYQMIIHQEDASECDESGFLRFLVDSPLEEESSLKLSHGYGSFHQQYWLDGQLIAVGVIDILPKCVSSVYLFYDPDYSFLSLGTYAALREIAFTRQLAKLSPELKSYYMGFYIHSCPKMRYKAQYSPSFLLCPETYTWHPYEEAKLNLEIEKYSRLERDSDKGDEDGEIVLNEILILYRRKIRSFPEYRAVTSGDDIEDINQYATLVGRKCYSRMLLYRN